MKRIPHQRLMATVKPVPPTTQRAMKNEACTSQ
jgi:hypothetical protein